jgi:hypothetical protein
MTGNVGFSLLIMSDHVFHKAILEEDRTFIKEKKKGKR